MSPLKNARHEAFAHALAQGLDGPRAYAAAGYRPSIANMARLIARPEIVSRMTELAQSASLSPPEARNSSGKCDTRTVDGESRAISLIAAQPKAGALKSDGSRVGERPASDVDEARCFSSSAVSGREEDAESSFGDVTAERVVRELARVAFADIRNVLTWRDETRVMRHDGSESVLPAAVVLKNSEDLDEDIAAAISEVVQTSTGLKIKLYDKRAALIDLGKYFGLFTPRAEEQATSAAAISDIPLDETEWAEKYAQGT